MYTHLLLDANIGNEYFLYHYSSRDLSKIERKRIEIISKAKEINNFDFSIHIRHTDEDTFSSVVELDKYFDVINPIESVDLFFKRLKTEERLNAVDVAAFLRQKYNINNAFVLQKLLYYIYADYMISYGTEPFKATFQAWDHGPVEPEVYKVNKNNSKFINDSVSFAEKTVDIDTSNLNNTISNVIKKYLPIYSKGEAFNDEEENLTHHRGTPWYLARKRKNSSVNHSNEDILIDDIKKFHYLEVIK